MKQALLDVLYVMSKPYLDLSAQYIHHGLQDIMVVSRQIHDSCFDRTIQYYFYFAISPPSCVGHAHDWSSAVVFGKAAFAYVPIILS